VNETAAAARALRRRLTVAATVAVAVLLAAMATLLLSLQRRQLVADVDEALRERANRLEAALAIGPSSVVDDPAQDDRAVQVVAAGGRIIAATANLHSTSPIAEPPDGDERIRTLDGLPIDEDEFRVLSRRVSVAGDEAVVHIAESIDDIDENVRVLGGSLLLAFPVALAALAGLTWWLVGRTLVPVEDAARRHERFVADASHELRSPLARMRARLEVDLAHPEGMDLSDTARDVLSETRGMERLVDDLLHLARSAAVREVGDDRRVDLDDVVLAEIVAARSAAAVAIDSSAVSGASVRGRREELARLVRNLLDNAVVHARGAVTVSLTGNGGQVVLYVDDDGPGIPLSRRHEVFDRFTRLDAARTAGGAGLGLAIAAEITHRHGGTISASDAPIGGARLTVVLPAS
jgi:signal transduction histidine kinase